MNPKIIIRNEKDADVDTIAVTNLIRYSDLQKQTRVLLSIKPSFAEAILRGEKKYEYRRTTFSRQVDVILIYVTAPIRRVVAEFDVISILSEPLPRLWNLTRKYAGIDKALFFRYFNGLKRGHAITIGDIRRYRLPFCPIEQLGLKPPQSFAYLDKKSCSDPGPS